MEEINKGNRQLESVQGSQNWEPPGLGKSATYWILFVLSLALIYAGLCRTVLLPIIELGHQELAVGVPAGTLKKEHLLLKNACHQLMWLEADVKDPTPVQLLR